MISDRKVAVGYILVEVCHSVAQTLEEFGTLEILNKPLSWRDIKVARIRILRQKVKSLDGLEEVHYVFSPFV